MIIHKNVCDYCSTESQIDRSLIDFSMRFTVLPVYDQVVESKRHSATVIEITVCSKNCMLEWLKENIAQDGQIKNKQTIDDDVPF